jgi:hypothetical protein
MNPQTPSAAAMKIAVHLYPNHKLHPADTHDTGGSASLSYYKDLAP